MNTRKLTALTAITAILALGEFASAATIALGEDGPDRGMALCRRVRRVLNRRRRASSLLMPIWRRWTGRTGRSRSR
jgi:hypothetical protein